MKGMIGDSQNPIRRRYGTIVKRLDGVIQQHSSIHPHTVSIHERTVAVASTHHTHTAPLTDVDVDTRCISLTQWPNRPRRTSCTTPLPTCLSTRRNARLYRTYGRKRLLRHAQMYPIVFHRRQVQGPHLRFLSSRCRPKMESPRRSI